MDVPTLVALLGDEGTALMDEACLGYGHEDTLALSARLRRRHPAALVAAALTQARLRTRAADKLDPADAVRMLFTDEGLQQATRQPVAEHRATRLAAALGPGSRVLDLGCGIGADLVALARTGLDVTGVERDPLTAAVARHNVAALRLAGHARVLEGDLTEADRSHADGVYCDPARRSAGRRRFDPRGWSPPWPFVEELLAGPGTAVVKVAPGIPHDLVPPGAEAEWVSERGDLVEATLWSASQATARRRATLLPGGATLTSADDPGPPEGVGVSDVLYEPDDAVVRAGLVTAVAGLVGGWLPDPRIAYVTAPPHVRTPFARAFAVLEHLPCNVGRLRAWVRAHDVGVLTVKKRGVGVEPEALRRALRPRGTAEATLVVTRVGGRATVLAVDPLS
jgi:SAM-dependent methyltransferase